MKRNGEKETVRKREGVGSWKYFTSPYNLPKLVINDELAFQLDSVKFLDGKLNE